MECAFLRLLEHSCACAASTEGEIAHTRNGKRVVPLHYAATTALLQVAVRVRARVKRDHAVDGRTNERTTAKEEDYVRRVERVAP